MKSLPLFPCPCSSLASCFLVSHQAHGALAEATGSAQPPSLPATPRADTASSVTSCHLWPLETKQLRTWVESGPPQSKFTQSSNWETASAEEHHWVRTGTASGHCCPYREEGDTDTQGQVCGSGGGGGWAGWMPLGASGRNRPWTGGIQTVRDSFTVDGDEGQCGALILRVTGVFGNAGPSLPASGTLQKRQLGRCFLPSPQFIPQLSSGTAGPAVGAPEGAAKPP